MELFPSIVLQNCLTLEKRLRPCMHKNKKEDNNNNQNTNFPKEQKTSSCSNRLTLRGMPMKCVSSLFVIVFTNLYDCAHVALVDEDENQNCADTAVSLHPMDAPFPGEAISSQVEEGVEYDRYQMRVMVVIYDGQTVEVNAAET